MKSLLFLGTSSGAGKTTLDAAFCRYLARKGVKVAPFKASNLSLNSYVTLGGEEIGMGQAFQAWASGLEPTGDMNPVLLEPSGPGRMQVVLRGKPYMDIDRDSAMDRKAVMEKACESYDKLLAQYDAVICEGSGSPAELNLMDTDMAGLDGDSAFIIPEHRRDDRGIGLGAAHEEIDLAFGAVAGLQDLFLRPPGIGIAAVAVQLFEIGLRKGPQDLGMGAFRVVASE